MPKSDRWFKMNEVLRELSREIGADYTEGDGPFSWGFRIEGSVHSYGAVHAHVAPWTVAIGSCTVVSKGSTSKGSTSTQMYAPYVNPDGFRFSIVRTSFFLGLGKKLGLVRHIVVGFPEFDEAFVIRGNDEERVRSLFADPKFRGLIQAQPTFRMDVKDKPWPFAIGAEPYFPENVDVLLFQVPKAITDVGQFKALFDAFIATLEQLCQLGAARREPPGVEPWGLFGLAMPKLSRPQIKEKP
jgi:hypothetical protein